MNGVFFVPKNWICAGISVEDTHVPLRDFVFMMLTKST